MNPIDYSFQLIKEAREHIIKLILFKEPGFKYEGLSNAELYRYYLGLANKMTT